MAIDYQANTENNTPDTTRNSNTDYTARTGESLAGYKASDVTRAIPSLSRVGAYQSLTAGVNLATTAYQSLLRITYAGIGLTRQVAQYGGRVGTPGASGQPIPEQIADNRNNDYKVNVDKFLRADTQYDYVFKIGSYFAPITTSYEISSSKNLADAQLVDGGEIVEKVNRKPKIVDLRIDIRLSDDFLATSSPFSFVDGNIDPDDEVAHRVEYDIVSLRAVLEELDTTNEVFQIRHAQLNNIYGLDWVVMEEFRTSSNRGSKIAQFSMRLREINMEENAIVFGQTTINSDSSAGAGETRL